MAEPPTADAIWFGTGPGARLARSLLLPFEQVYAGIITLRGAAYDRGILASHDPVLPVLSIGNLSVGGTGKTPVAAWVAGELLAAGATPAIVLRGYGDDEPLVHQTLQPDVHVVVAPDRVAGVKDARSRGADIAVLDDGFQHRRIRRHADWVLISADRWTGERIHLVPAGPWRERLAALKRASLVVVTRKAAARGAATEVTDAVRRHAPAIPVASVHLAPNALRRLGDSGHRDLASLRGARVRLVAAVADPNALRAQIEAQGAIVDGHFFPDHHAFTEAEVAGLASGLAADTVVMCTLKDAVKIAPRWPRAGPALWYVSQRVIVEDGADHLSRSIRTVLNARSSVSDATGTGRSSF